MDDVLERWSAILGDEVDPEYRDALELACCLLARGPRTEHQVQQKLAAAGIDEDAGQRALARLRSLCLVDDLDYARQWIEERSRRIGRGAEALIGELGGKGVDRDVAERAMAEMGFDEVAVARVWAARLVPKVMDRPLPEQGLRLRLMLLRRGFSEEAATEGARAALPPEGWD
ncbi:MAG: regulatory protein RecX [Actinomycetota bacterium]